MKIFVTGSIAYDILLQYDGSFADAIAAQEDAEKLSVSFFSPHFAKHHGGTGANIAWNLRLLRQAPLLVGTVGNDGGAYTALLEERGIDVSRIEKVPTHVTATAIIGTDSEERQIAFFHPGADSHGTFPDLADDREDIAIGIVSPRDVGVMLQAVRQCQMLKIPYLFDPGQQVIRLSAEELIASAQKSSGVIVNSYEWELLLQRSGLSSELFLETVPMLMVTEGDEGVTIYTAADTVHIPACRADRVVNPTGAGDAFRAGVLTGIAKGWPVKTCAQLGAAVASFVVEQEGTLLDTLDLDEVRQRARQAYGEELPLFF